MEATKIQFRWMEPDEVTKIKDIDRSERIRSGYQYVDGELQQIEVNWDSPPWSTEDDGEYTVAAQIRFCQGHLERNGRLYGAFIANKLVGIGLIQPDIAPGTAQLAYLHVSNRYRHQGIGRQIAETLLNEARQTGAVKMYVSTTPSASTVNFYMRLGFQPTNTPIPELFALEPEDIHMVKELEQETGCRLLTLADVDSAAQVISQAFVDDPLCTFMLPLQKTRVKTLSKFFRAYGALNIKNQSGYGVGEPLQGVAYWIFPEQTELSISVKSLSIFIPLLFTYYPIGLWRARAVTKKIDALHQKYANEPHFYLDNIGVLASARGQGLASKLIRPFLEKADSEKVMVYTDTVTPTNVPFYEHFGFECVEESAVEGTGITVWALRRPIQ